MPQRRWSSPAYGSLKVDPPRVAVRIEVERTERDDDLQRPPDLAAQHPRVPDPVPFPVFAVDPEERIRHQSRGIHLEEITGAAVEKGVDRPHEAVVRVEPLVAPALVANPLVGLRVEARDAKVQRLVVERDADFRRLRGRASVLRVLLDEVARGHRLRPERLVEPAVQYERLAIGQAKRGDAAAAVVVGRRRLGAGERDGDQQDPSRSEELTGTGMHEGQQP
jgi:hypothetical protein